MSDTVLYDLDGTLVNSAAGILGSLRAAFDEVGLAWPGFDTTVVGPPIYKLLPEFIGDDATVEVVAAYRRHYGARGLYDSQPFPGVDELLTTLRDRGIRLAVATSKAEPFAIRIVESKGWTSLFDTVCGDTLAAERPTKAQVIRETLSRLGEADAIMVGDKHTDVTGARENSIPCIGVGWGYGRPGELDGALAVVSHPDDLVQRLVAPIRS
jgi:phosphoglycolate phosphatase